MKAEEQPTQQPVYVQVRGQTSSEVNIRDNVPSINYLVSNTDR